MHLVEDDELVGGRPALPAVLLRPADPEPAVAAHLPHQVTVCRTERLAAGSERRAALGGHEAFEVSAQLLLQVELLSTELELHQRNLPRHRTAAIAVACASAEPSTVSSHHARFR